ncbi:MAG: endonuclease/exonuclease/phosphatase family protein [Clostridia bacterium]|nr:endonuclease/exonuclease/phosphatase family protein [Clostridia bacterium]
MKLLTLNTHSWQETDNVSCLRHVSETLRQEQPDVIALQEVNQNLGSAPAAEQRLKDSGFVTSGDTILEDNWALRLSELAPGYHWSWAYAHIGYRTWKEGVAILSRSPILEVRSRDLSADNVKLRRRALAVRNRFGWFISAHLGWWDDPLDPFPGQWARLNAFARSLEGPCYLMGDFNSPAHVRDEGYDLMLADGWQDCYTRAEERDSGVTVPGQIDGWRQTEVNGFRLDFCLAGQPGRTLRSRVIFNGDFYPAVSDHFGVLTEES